MKIEVVPIIWEHNANRLEGFLYNLCVSSEMGHDAVFLQTDSKLMSSYLNSPSDLYSESDNQHNIILVINDIGSSKIGISNCTYKLNLITPLGEKEKKKYKKKRKNLKNHFHPEHITQASLFSNEHCNFASSN